MMIKLVNKFYKNFSTISEQIAKNKNSYGNVTPKIAELADIKLIENPNHPLGILRYKMEEFFMNERFFKSDLQQRNPQKFIAKSDFSPIVNTFQNFDELLIPKDHISRKRSDTYYITEDLLLRTHATAHEKQMFQDGNNAFLIFANCFRRDEIDSTHYPAFHQMEAVRTFDVSEFDQPIQKMEDLQIQIVLKDLQETWERLARFLFGDNIWVPAYFPFTEPSIELEIFYNNEWLEMLGSGILRRQIMDNFGRPKTQISWASGCGLERFAMLLFDIPDIRYFWSKDSRFLEQFQEGKINKFKVFSKYPICYKDMSFWLNEEQVKTYEENDFMELIRGQGGDLIEKVEMFDKYEDVKRKRTSLAYRITYRSLDRTLTNSEIDDIQFKIRDLFKETFEYELR